MAHDSSCNGNDGTLRGYPSPDWRAGRSGGALAFNGTSEWLRVPASSSIGSIAARGTFTLAAWTNRTRNGTPWGNIVGRQYRTSGSEHYTLTTLNDKPRFIVDSYTAGAACEAGSITPPGQWVHLAATYDGSVGRLYVDGIEACSFTRTLSQMDDTTPLIIGGNANTASDDAQELFGGLLDDVLVYSRALTAAEIGALATGNPPPRQ
jgi:hypothetical protein